MAQPVVFEVPAPALQLARQSLGDAHEAAGRFIEAARQAYELFNQSADVMLSGATEFNEKAAQHADEHLRLSFALAACLIEAKDVKEVLHAQREFALETVNAYGRQVRELSRLVTHLTQHPDPIGEQ